MADEGIAFISQLNRSKRRKPLILDIVAPFLCCRGRSETKNDYYNIRMVEIWEKNLPI